jgi:hypothetical protein
LRCTGHLKQNLFYSIAFAKLKGHSKFILKFKSRGQSEQPKNYEGLSTKLAILVTRSFKKCLKSEIHLAMSVPHESF